MYYKFVYFLSGVLRLCPRWFVSECLKRYCPACWAELWPKSAYIEMIEISKGRPTSLKSSKKENSNIANSLFEKWDEEYNHLLYESTGRYYFPEKPEFLSFDPSDWYFLLRIAIFELYDDDMKCLWCGEEGEHGELYIHSNLYLLMDAVDNGLFKEKK